MTTLRLCKCIFRSARLHLAFECFALKSRCQHLEGKSADPVHVPFSEQARCKLSRFFRHTSASYSGCKHPGKISIRFIRWRMHGCRVVRPQHLR